MSPLFLFLLLIPLSTPLPQTQKLLTNHTPQQRPTRTLGSLFGSSKPSPPSPPQPPQQIPNEQKSINVPQYSGSGVRPLVYQVKYYDRVQNNLIDYPDPRNYNAIDKAGVNVVEQQPQGVVQGFNGQVVGQPPIIPPRYYYNPLIPPIQEPLVYTIANIGNTQVLIPCSTPSTDPYIYDSTIALNVEQPQQLQQPSLRVPVTQQYQVQQQQQQPPVPTSLPNRTPILPPSTVQQPLIREQVVAAAAELSALNALPGSGIVGANINSVPYTQGSYFYYYLLPGNQQDPQQLQIQPQVRYQPQLPQYQPQYQHNPFSQFINPYTRYNQNNVIPVVLTGYPGYPGNQQVVIPQPSNVNSVVSKGQQVQSQVQGQTTQQQQQQQTQQQQQVKG